MNITEGLQVHCGDMASKRKPLAFLNYTKVAGCQGVYLFLQKYLANR